MSAAALPLRAHEALLPPRGGGAGGRGALLSLLAHGGLVAALAWGVQWRIDQPQVLSAELWASVPQQAAPPPPPPAAPPPTPAPAPVPAPAAPKAAEPEAQIAVERAERAERDKREQAQRDKARTERERREQEARDKARDAARAETQKREQELREAKAQDERLARQREDNLRRVLAAAGAGSAPTANTSGSGARDAAPSAAYAGRLRARIRPNIVFAEDARGNPEAEVEVSCAAEGTIISRRIVKSSGLKAWDDAVLRAIDRTERLPPDVDGRVPAKLIIAFRPRE